jgi:hypothetical protein
MRSLPPLISAFEMDTAAWLMPGVTMTVSTPSRTLRRSASHLRRVLRLVAERVSQATVSIAISSWLAGGGRLHCAVRLETK